jgi:acyl-homoserine lactone acylase PvdQ
MKSNSLAMFEKSMQLKGNTSTNTMYADNKGNIAYWHGNFIPRRDSGYDWSRPVDGTTSATEWKGVHELNEIIHSKNPRHGYIQNCNSTPFSMSGFYTVQKMYPDYMAREGENFRSLRAIQLLNVENKFTLEKLSVLGYDRYLSLFDSLLPSIIIAHETLAPSDPLYSFLKEPFIFLKTWDRRSSVSSVATTIAIFWAYQLLSVAKLPAHESTQDHLNYVRSIVTQTTSKQKLKVLQSIIAGLQKLYGTWKIPWGDVNRYQRTKTSASVFSDSEPSLPVALAPAFFGSLPSFETIWGDTKQYGVAGNSFTAIVEFGEKVKARSIVMGGQYFEPQSKHFIDQAAMCIEGKFKDVLFYKEDVQKNAVRSYHPGDN